MARICFITGRKPVKGNIIHRRGQTKKSGGIGTHVTGITRRKFRPNLQHVHIRLPNGSTKDTAFVVKPVNSQDIFDIRVKDILCMPVER